MTLQSAAVTALFVASRLIVVRIVRMSDDNIKATYFLELVLMLTEQSSNDDVQFSMGSKLQVITYLYFDH